MQYSPIALFTYSRADHTRQAVESLLKNVEARDSELFIFSDGPKTEEKRAAVEETRRYIHTISGFKSITIVEREKNWGLANSLIVGITEIVNKYGRVIVVEDDLIVSPYFLKFMNDAIEKYEDEDKVGAVCAYLPNMECNLPENFFITFMHPWGWATWKRSWDLLNTDTKYLLRKLRFKANEYDIGSGQYGSLLCQKYGLVDSWYVRFYASLFLKDKLIFYPGKSLISNIGLDGSGTHCRVPHDDRIYGHASSEKIQIEDNIEIVKNSHVTKCYINFFKSSNKQPKNVACYFNIIKGFIRRILYIDCL